MIQRAAAMQSLQCWLASELCILLLCPTNQVHENIDNDVQLPFKPISETHALEA